MSRSSRVNPQSRDEETQSPTTAKLLPRPSPRLKDQTSSPRELEQLGTPTLSKRRESDRENEIELMPQCMGNSFGVTNKGTSPGSSGQLLHPINELE